jgi:mRNA interferase MazF
VTFDPIVGSEQAGTRPTLIISADRFQRMQDRLAMVVPLTRTHRPYPFHVEVLPGESGLRHPSVIMSDQPRMISTQRLLDDGPIGRVSHATLNTVEGLLRALLDLP